MGSVVGLPPNPPSQPLRCEDPECRKTTFFVYQDGHIRCASCGLADMYSPLDPVDFDEEESALVFEADPSLLAKLE